MFTRVYYLTHQPQRGPLATTRVPASCELLARLELARKFPGTRVLMTQESTEHVEEIPA